MLKYYKIILETSLFHKGQQEREIRTSHGNVYLAESRVRLSLNLALTYNISFRE